MYRALFKITTFAVTLFLFMTTPVSATWTILEGFEGGAIPGGWTVYDNDGDGDQWEVQLDPSVAHTGGYFARVFRNVNLNDDWLITPQVTLGLHDEFIVWARSSNPSYPEYFDVMLSTTGTAIADFTVTLGSFASIPSSYTEYTIDLLSYAGQDVYLAIRCVSGDAEYLYVDDVGVWSKPPHDVEVTSLTPDAVVMVGESHDYTIEIENVGTSDDIYDLSAAGGSFVYVIRDSADTSDISSLAVIAGASQTCILRVTVPVGAGTSQQDAVTFTATSQGDGAVSDDHVVTTTGCGMQRTSFTEGFEGLTPPEFATCWEVTNDGSGNQWETVDDPTYAHGGDMSARYSYHHSYSADTWFFTHPLAMQAGITYNLSFWYRIAQYPHLPESMDVWLCDGQASGNVLVELWDDSAIANTAYLEGTATFTVASDGTYYLGFHCYSLGDSHQLFVDDISVPEIVPVELMGFTVE